ncbi:MAG: ribosomal-processing cysteine protease Prp [Bacilli bacterium]|nr:ribosomal-processing cysteine protease Prp [Bacilli bacterium]
MIKVIVSTDKINILGHADFGTYGKDIVCSSVSSIMTTTVNGILRFNNKYISYKKNENEFSIVINEHNEIVDNLIENMISLFKELEKDYPKNIKIEEEY